MIRTQVRCDKRVSFRDRREGWTCVCPSPGVARTHVATRTESLEPGTLGKHGPGPRHRPYEVAGAKKHQHRLQPRRLSPGVQGHSIDQPLQTRLTTEPSAKPLVLCVCVCVYGVQCIVTRLSKLSVKNQGSPGRFRVTGPEGPANARYQIGQPWVAGRVGGSPNQPKPSPRGSRGSRGPMLIRSAHGSGRFTTRGDNLRSAPQLTIGPAANCGQLQSAAVVSAPRRDVLPKSEALRRFFAAPNAHDGM